MQRFPSLLARLGGLPLAAALAPLVAAAQTPAQALATGPVTTTPSAPSPASAPAIGTPRQAYVFYERTDSLGRLDRASAMSGGVPFDRPWDGLTPAQQACVRARYDGMPADQEPPFPLAGLQSLYQPIVHASAVGLPGAGPWSLALTVGPDGRVTAFTIVQAPDRDIAMAVGRELVDIRFKPGLCRGRPCQMDFPVDFVMH